jgi:hypothetical protein
VDTWFENGLLAIAPASFKVLGSSGSPQPSGPAPAVETILAIRRDGERKAALAYRLFTISILRFSSLKQRGEVIPTVVVFETRGHSTRDSRR